MRVRGGISETCQRWKDADPDIPPALRWKIEGEQSRSEELLSESPGIKALLEQWETLCIQDGVLQKGWEDAARKTIHITTQR